MTLTEEQRKIVQREVEQYNAATGGVVDAEAVERMVEQRLERYINWQLMERLVIRRRLYWPIRMEYRRKR
jgi:hypothetical protein